MSVGYRAVQWNAHKRWYDTVIAGFVVAYLVVFVGVGLATHPPPRDISIPILLIRALATLGILLLHIILAIGPLARLDDRFAPLLYNRRHLGVSFFLIALAHAALATLYYGGFGSQNPLLAVLTGYGDLTSISAFPFEVLGFLALLVFFVMAATSHDFWLANLSPRVWKWIHMAVYPAYWLVVGHVVLGALQSERSPVFASLVFGGAVGLIVLHGVAAIGEHRRTRRTASADRSGWVDIGPLADIDDGSAKIVCLADGERIAVFRYGDKVSAVSNTCAHQGGPLGEGRVIDGCITCPWHGYQYLPESGQSPPPYSENIPTYAVRVEGERVLVDPNALPPGTETPPAVLPGSTPEADSTDRHKGPEEPR